MLCSSSPRTTRSRRQSAASPARCGTPTVRAAWAGHLLLLAPFCTQRSTGAPFCQHVGVRSWFFIKMLHCTAVHSRPASEPAPTSRARTPPAVFPDGRVCISILHPPGDDQYGYEQASERWSPVHGVSGGRARATDVRARGMLTAWLWPGMQLPQPASQPAWRYCTRISQVESIILSIISMLSSPNDESPANIDAAKQWREDRDGFKKKVCVG